MQEQGTSLWIKAGGELRKTRAPPASTKPTKNPSFSFEVTSSQAPESVSSIKGILPFTALAGHRNRLIQTLRISASTRRGGQVPLPVQEDEDVALLYNYSW